MCPVDEVFAFSGAVQAACYAHFDEINVKGMIFIVHYERYFAHTGGFAALCSGKYHVLHAASAQRFGALFAQYPFNGIGNVAFSAAVGANDGRYAVAEFQYCLVYKGLESLHLEPLKIQCNTPLSRSTDFTSFCRCCQLIDNDRRNRDVQSSELRGEEALFLIYTAANNEKSECGRVTRFPDTAAIGKRQRCGRVFCSFIRPQKGKRRNAAV